MTKTLTGLHVLVTRPARPGEALCALIEGQGGEAIYFPTILFGPPPEPEQFAAAIEQLGSCDWLVFVSPQAVYASAPAIHKRWPALPSNVQFASLGAGTAEALREMGYTASIYPESEWNSENILDLPAFQAIAGKKIAIVRGEGGRELMDKIFQERGAQVVHVVAYQRILPIVDVLPLLALLSQKLIHAIVCTSFEGLQNLVILLTEANRNLLYNIALVVPSERIKILAQGLGFQTIWVARSARNEAILDTLAEKKEEICQMPS